MGGCLSSSPGGGSADAAALAVKGQATHATTQSFSPVFEEQKQQGPSKQEEEDKQLQQPGGTTRGHDSSASCPGTDGPIQNNLLHRVVAESSPSTPVTQPGSSARSPDLPPRPSSTDLSTEQAARAKQKSSGCELHAFQQPAPDARHAEEQPASSTSPAQPTTHAEKSAAAAAKKPKSLKSRLLAAANLESIEREAEPTTCSTAPQQSTAHDTPTASSPYATPPNSRTPIGGSAGTGAGYPSSLSSARTLSAAAGLNAASNPGVRLISSRAMTLAGPGAASALMSQVETRLIEAEQLLGQQRSVKPGNSESSLTKPPEVRAPPTREEMMMQLDLAEKKLMGMRRKEGGSGYA